MTLHTGLYPQRRAEGMADERGGQVVSIAAGNSVSLAIDHAGLLYQVTHPTPHTLHPTLYTLHPTPSVSRTIDYSGLFYQVNRPTIRKLYTPHPCGKVVAPGRGRNASRVSGRRVQGPEVRVFCRSPTRVPCSSETASC